jgi:hypothetical protein
LELLLKLALALLSGLVTELLLELQEKLPVHRLCDLVVLVASQP